MLLELDPEFIPAFDVEFFELGLQFLYLFFVIILLFLFVVVSACRRLLVEAIVSVSSSSSCRSLSCFLV